jgi:aspartyl-tRNA(Asn)/glutamyl-tRNA(Gln) amidotransferase subunit B
MPKLPPEIRETLNKLSIESKVIEDILDNEKVCKKAIDSLNSGASAGATRRVAFDSLEVSESLSVEVEDHIKLAQMLIDGQISSSAEKEILLLKAKQPEKTIDELAEAKRQLSDEGEIEKIVAEVLEQNVQAATDVKNGEMKAIGFLVGQVMAKSQGKANPQLAQQLIKKQLGL